MLVIQSPKYCFKRQFIWNYNDEKISLASSNIFIHSLKKPTDNSINTITQYTTSIQLEKSIEDIRKSFKGKLNWYINKAAKLGFEYNIILDFNKGIIDDIIEEYNLFARHKQIEFIDSKLFLDYIKSGKVQLTSISLNGQTLIKHIYLISELRCILMYSFNVLKKDVLPQLRSTANRYLHFLDLKEFKNKGYTVYDFGGISMNELDQLRQFKLSFGGVIEEQYTYSVNRGILALYKFFK